MDLARQFTYITQHGFHYSYADRPAVGFAPKPGSHDDGPHNGPFLGGIGAPAFGRSLNGVFNRWHLQPGYHAVREIPAAQLCIWWKPVSHEASGDSDGNNVGGCRLLSLQSLETIEIGGIQRCAADEMETAVLFPFTIEHFAAADMPVELYVRFFSPIVPDKETASALPIVYIDVEIHNCVPQQLEVAAALFWPNQLGWRQPLDASERQTVCFWPARSNYGNINMPADLPLDPVGIGLDEVGGSGMSTTAVLQTRNPHRPVRRDLEGEVLVAAYTTDSTAILSRELTFKTEPNGTGIAPEEQPYTFPWALRHFSIHGRLPQREESWSARCHEGLGSAVAVKTMLPPGGISTVENPGPVDSPVQLHFLLVHDLPLVEFGGGQVWKRAYCAEYGSSGRNSRKIAAAAMAGKKEWEESIERWQHSISHGSLINDLYFLVGGGTAWVSGAVDESMADAPGNGPVGGVKSGLKRGPHFALLEGFDTGYYYYNTFDLWVYAFPALVAGWKTLAASVFNDYLLAVDTQDISGRVIYRQGERRPVLLPGKIPHDLGSAMEDPWYALNAYSWRDDPNVWRDHNPGFILSYYLFRRYSGGSIHSNEYRVLVRAAEYMLAQDSDNDGLPEHGEFGDSTWDALALSGIGAYSGALAIGALAVMTVLSEECDPDAATKYRQLALTAVQSYQRALWNGSYFNNSSMGKYASAIQVDALFGVYLADLAGLRENSAAEAGTETGEVLLPVAQIRSHLLAVYEYNFRAYDNGRVGPLLVTNPGSSRYARDGGEDLQLGEVIVGSAWAYAAMLDYYGLELEAKAVESALVRTLYEDSGLQFRTPAAWDAEGLFRAPLNMRPLASWFLYLNEATGRPCTDRLHQQRS